MKVLYLLPEILFGTPNARQTRATRLLPALDKLVDLTVISFGRVEDTAPAVTKRVHAPLESSRANLARATFSKRPRVFSRYSSRAARDIFRREVERFEPDIVHFDSFGTLALLPEAKRLSARHGFHIVVHTHDSITLSSRRRTESLRASLRKLDFWLQSRKIERVERTLYPLASLSLVDSEEDAAFLRSASSASNVQVLSLGYDEDVFRPGGSHADIRKPAIVFSGSMRSMQSLDAAQYLVRDIMPQVWRQVPDAVVYLVGAGAGEQLDMLARERPGQVIITGFVEDLAAYLRAATIYVSPLRLGSGMRTRVVEAAACGCAIVSSPEGIHGLTVDGDHMPWRIASDSQSFASEIVRLLTNDKERIELGRTARSAVENRYSWSRIAERLLAYYERLASRATPHGTRVGEP